MYLLHEKDQPLSFQYAERQPSFFLFTKLLKKEENMITLSTVTDPKMIPLAQFIYKTW